MARRKGPKKIVKSMRLTLEQYDEIQRVASELNLADSDLMRVGTIMTIKMIEDGSIDWTEFYKYAATS